MSDAINLIEMTENLALAMDGLLGRNRGGGRKSRLKIAREVMGLSQSEFSVVFGLPADTIKNLEAKSRPEPSGISALFIDFVAADPAAMLELAKKTGRLKQAEST